MSRTSGEGLFDDSVPRPNRLGRFVFWLFLNDSDVGAKAPNEVFNVDIAIGLSVPSQSNEPGFYDQGSHLPSLLQVW
jgi:hypothetical protein